MTRKNYLFLHRLRQSIVIFFRIGVPKKFEKIKCVLTRELYRWKSTFLQIKTVQTVPTRGYAAFLLSNKKEFCSDFFVKALFGSKF